MARIPTFMRKKATLEAQRPGTKVELPRNSRW
jgi:hypothetical protein